MDFVEATGSSTKHLTTIQGGYHDLIGGQDRVEHVKDIIEWVLATAAAGPENSVSRIGASAS